MHYYQPGWTMVGGGIFQKEATCRRTSDLIPKGVMWLKSSVVGISPEQNGIELDSGNQEKYDYLVVAPGLKLCWETVEGLSDTLGKNGVTSNYRFDLAPYTWDLVQNLESGNALFTQPPMPIKCAGAPQKAMYLSCSHWLKKGVLKNIDVSFHNAGGVLFGVPDYLPALMDYVEKYNARLCFNQNLSAIDGGAKKAWFNVTDADGNVSREERDFDMIHVCPPQSAPDFIINSPLANEAGWVDVDQATLRHTRYANIYSLGDACSTANAKTAAAVRKQAPVVAINLLADINNSDQKAYYKGYGSCPLTVEHGKIVLAEFGYGGKLQPTFPKWVLNGLKATTLAWILKKDILPFVYWNVMLKGREWLVAPDMDAD
jgi:sulfide:quinone oxidoreductase